MSAQITILSGVSRIDEPISIELSGFTPGASVEVTSVSRHSDQTQWQARATFVADTAGQVNLATAQPTSGDYTGVDGAGLIWAQTLDAATPPQPINDATAPIVTTLTAKDSAGLTATATLTRYYRSDAITRREVRENGLVGTLFTPTTPGPHPAIIYFNGSGGGINETRAALWAQQGYAALALGYFGAPGLPSHISGTPLEYFEKGLQWVRDNVQPAGGFIAVSGQSRGGELSLLLAATYPDLVSAVIAYVPSSVVHSVLAAGTPGESRYATAWTKDGQPLATIWDNNTRQDGWDRVDQSAEPRRQAQPFVDAQTNTQAYAAARIPVERIQGPVLLISGGDDGYWPSSDYARDVAQQLRAANHPHAVEHLDYPGAGHSIQAPHVPATQIAKAHAVSGVILTAGGTPAANAQANADSWAKSLTFLAEAVKKANATTTAS